MSLLENLTDRQLQIYEFVRDKIRTRGYGPTVREIGLQFSISSPNGVMCHLKALEKKGMIRRDPNKSRAIELTHETIQEKRGLPLAGCVAAGMTTLAFEQNDTIDLSELFSKKNLFVLEVRGDSMIEAHIADGDFVVLRKQRTATPGQIVAAQTPEGEATLKYWFPEHNRIRLQPANRAMEPIYVAEAEVLGVVVGVVRTCD